MKKITLLLVAFAATFTMNAQMDCANAQTVTLTTNTTTTVNASGISGTATTVTCNPTFYANTDISMSNWYTFTPTQDMIITVNCPSPDPQNPQYVASFSVLEGTCGNLTCVDGDIITQNQTTGQLFDAEVSFVATANTTYYVAFDDFYSNTPGLGTLDPFDFTVMASINAAPDAVSTPTPADASTDVDVYLNANNSSTVDFSWQPATTGGLATEYEFYLSDPTATDPTALTLLGSTANTSVSITGMTNADTYYWMIVPKNIAGSATGSATWSFTTETLGVNDIAANNFDFYTNNENLFVTSELSIDNLTIYNLLGQKVNQTEINNTNGQVNIANLQNGVYVGQVTIEGQTKSFKFVKK